MLKLSGKDRKIDGECLLYLEGSAEKSLLLKDMPIGEIRVLILVRDFYFNLSKRKLIDLIQCIFYPLSQNKKALNSFNLSALVFFFVLKCDSAGIRTQDPILKRDVLYLLSY